MDNKLEQKLCFNIENIKQCGVFTDSNVVGKNVGEMMQALENVRVVDFSQWLPGQYCGMVLADFGAEVIKVEAPQGDPNRAFTPHLAPDMSSWNLALNRNKKGITVNLKIPEGREILQKLLTRADVFLEGFRPGYLAKIGLDYESIRAINPRLIYCSVTGFGQKGKYKDQPAHDLNIMGLSGMEQGIGTDHLAVNEAQISALAGSLNAVAAISMALFCREKSGKGQQIDISLFNSAVGMQIVSIASLLGCRITGDTPFGRRAHYYDVYQTKDGRYLSVGTIEPKFWKRFCEAADLPELKDRQYDFEYEREITEQVRSKVAGKTREEWLQLLENGQFCVTPVYSVEEALETDLMKASGMLETREEDLGPVTYVKSAVTLSESPGRIRFRAPYRGEHNQEILRELGYSAEEMEILKQKGAI